MSRKLMVYNKEKAGQNCYLYKKRRFFLFHGKGEKDILYLLGKNRGKIRKEAIQNEI